MFFYKRPYFLPLSMMLAVALLLIIFFGVREHRYYSSKIANEFSVEAERIDNSLSNIFEHTEFVMKLILAQITPHHHDLKYIEDVIGQYVVSKNFNNVLSWTSFSWQDKDLVKRVNSIEGTSITQSNKSQCEFLNLAKKQPGIIHLGDASFDFLSQKYVIPASLGGTLNNNFIGALSIGFDVAKLGSTLKEVLKNSDIKLAMLDQNLEVIYSPFYQNEGVTPSEVKKLLKEQKVVFEKLDQIYDINLLENGMSYYIYRISNYPFAIYLKLDNKNYSDQFWRDITYRAIEVLVIGCVALLIVIAIYKREKMLRDKAEIASQLALNASRAKTDFLAYTAHELRSPLGFIITSSELMTKKLFGELNQQYLEYIRNINQTSVELVEFINDLLDEMKTEEGVFQVVFDQVDIVKILQKSIKLNMMNYNHKIIIETKIAEKLPALRSDNKRLLQVFNNIISNAIKYSPQNSTLLIEAFTTNDSLLKIIFTDQGCGMSQEELAISLDKYGIVQKENPLSLGLGLPLVKELLDALGGTLTIESKERKGTTVTISFELNNS